MSCHQPTATAVPAAALRLVVVLVGLALTLLVAATPVSAHAGGPTDATNYRSSVIELVDVATGDVVSPDGITARVVGPDEQLELTSTREEVVVRGYQGEEFLRVGPGGVFENRRSPSTWLSRDRLGDTPVPQQAAANAPPEWVQVSSSSRHRWYDHRIHWTDDALPILPAVDPSRPAPVRDWSVPVELGGEELAVQGRLDWAPGPSAPVLVASGVLVGLLAAAAVRWRRPGRARSAATTLVALGAGALTVRTVDDLLATRTASTSAIVLTVALAAATVALCVLAVVRVRRRHPQAVPTVLLGALAVAAVLGVTQLDLLTGSQLVTLLPPVVTRVLVVGALVLPIAVVVLLSGPDPADPTRAAPPSRVGTTVLVTALALTIGALLLAVPGAGRRVPTGLAACGMATVSPVPLPAGERIPVVGDPPTVGPGRADRFGIGVRDGTEPYDLDEQVAILRAGAVVARHASDDAPTAALLRDVARSLPRRIAVTPSSDVEPGSVSLLAWGIAQTCRDASAEAVTDHVIQWSAELPLVPGRDR